MIDSWEENLAEQQKRGFKNYAVLILDLTTARTDELYSVSGDILQISKTTSDTAKIDVRFNRKQNEAIEFCKHTEVKTIFTELYISNDAQPDEVIELLVGINFEITRENIDRPEVSQPVQTITIAGALANTTGDDQVCDIVLLKADVNNAGTAWVNFGVTSAQYACLPLDPGDCATVRVSNTNQINVMFEGNNQRLFVVFEQ